jgi:hypothetical protein
VVCGVVGDVTRDTVQLEYIVDETLRHGTLKIPGHDYIYDQSVRVSIASNGAAVSIEPVYPLFISGKVIAVDPKKDMVTYTYTAPNGETRNVTDTVLSVKKSLLKSGENVNTEDRLLLMVNCLTDISNLKRPMICFTAAPFPTALIG